MAHKCRRRSCAAARLSCVADEMIKKSLEFRGAGPRANGLNRSAMQSGPVAPKDLKSAGYHEVTLVPIDILLREELTGIQGGAETQRRLRIDDCECAACER